MSGEKRALEDFCPRCGLKISKHSAPGSMTGYMFDPVRCKCATGDTMRPSNETHAIKDRDDGIFNVDAPGAGARTFAVGQGAEALSLQLGEGAIIGGLYSIIKPIGQGGMGVVYLALHQTLRKRCAIKLIPPEQVTSSSWKRFQQEAKIIAKLDHINLVKVTDLGLHKGYLPFYAMEYIDGETLAESLMQRKRLALSDAIAIFIQVCEGVDYAHRAGIIHRDLKPGNIMIAGNEVKILDFGLAKLTKQDRHEQSLTRTGDVFGSPFYMSPEQCAGQKVDNRSDIYSIGCTLFESLTGQPPFASSNSAKVMLSHQEDDPPSLASLLGPGKMPDSIEIVLAKLLRKNPVERYQTCRELATDLDKINRGESVQPFYMPRAAKISGTESGALGVDVDEAETANSIFSPGALIACGFVLTVVLGGGLAYYLSLSKPKIVPRSNVLTEMQTSDKAASKALASGATDTMLTDRMNTFLGHSVDDGAEPASARQTGFYSTAESRKAKKRVFNFPTDTLIGSVRASSSQPHVPASGRITMIQQPLSFIATEDVIKYPQYLQRFRNGEISKIRFENTNNTDAACAAIRYLPNWQTLPSLALKGFSRPFSPASQLILGSLDGLRFFEFSNSMMDPKVVAQMPLLTNVEDLTLGKLRGYEPIIETLTHSEKLKKIAIIRGDLTDKDLQNLTKIGTLQDIWLEQVPMNSARLKILQKCPSLALLNLEAPILKDPDLEKALHQFPKLVWVQFLHVPNDLVPVAKQLQAKMPKVRIKIDEQKGSNDADFLK